MSKAARGALAPLLIVALSGCSMTETTTAVRVQLGPSTERIRLMRPDAAPIAAVWRQDESSLVGQLSFTKACNTETVQVSQRTEITDTHANRNYLIGAYVAGAALSLLGVAVFANAQGKSERVTCGSGDDAPKSGDKCESEAGAWRALGGITIGAGLGAILGGAIVQSRKYELETKALPSGELVRTIPNRDDCGTTKSFEGAVVRASLSSGGSWAGIVDSEGAVRIELTGAALSQGARAAFSLESVPLEATKLSLSGTSLGELELQGAGVALRRSSPARASAFIRR
jgi:hypothetical protein